MRRGGGLATVYRSNLKVAAIETDHTGSMEYIVLKVNTGTVTINIIAIYHPPYSIINQSTSAMFLDDLANVFEKHLMSLSNILVTGDFNLHMDKMDDPDVNIFKDMVQAFGPDCQVDFPTHPNRHTLDLVLTEAFGNIRISLCELEYSSQATIVSNPFTTSRKLNWRGKNCLIGKLMLLMYRTSVVHLNQLKALPLEDKIKQFNSELIRVLDKLAPLKTRTITLHPSNPLVHR